MRFSTIVICLAIASESTATRIPGSQLRSRSLIQTRELEEEIPEDYNAAEEYAAMMQMQEKDEAEDEQEDADTEGDENENEGLGENENGNEGPGEDEKQGPGEDDYYAEGDDTKGDERRLDAVEEEINDDDAEVYAEISGEVGGTDDDAEAVEEIAVDGLGDDEVSDDASNE